MFSKALLDFPKVSDATLVIKAASVLAGMTGNPNYPGATSFVTALNAAAEAYSTALAVAEFGSPAQISEKNDRKAELVVALRNVCSYVNYTTPGERTLLLTTGFTIGKDEVQPVVTEPLKSFKVVNGPNRGTIVATAKKGAGTDHVLIEYAVGTELAAINSWSSCPGTKSSCTVSGLKSGETVWFRACAVGPRNQVIRCAPVQTLVL